MNVRAFDLWSYLAAGYENGQVADLAIRRVGADVNADDVVAIVQNVADGRDDVKRNAELYDLQ